MRTGLRIRTDTRAHTRVRTHPAGPRARRGGAGSRRARAPRDRLSRGSLCGSPAPCGRGQKEAGAERSPGNVILTGRSPPLSQPGSTLRAGGQRPQGPGVPLPLPFQRFPLGAQVGGEDRRAPEPRVCARCEGKTVIKSFGNSLGPGSVAETWTPGPETRTRTLSGGAGLALTADPLAAVSFRGV